MKNEAVWYTHLWAFTLLLTDMVEGWKVFAVVGLQSAAILLNASHLKAARR